MLPAGMNYLMKIQLETQRELVHNRHPRVQGQHGHPPVAGVRSGCKYVGLFPPTKCLNRYIYIPKT